MAYIIAEIGSNWRNEHIAKVQIREAKALGADAVKFQMFTHEELYNSPGVSHGLPKDLVPSLAEYSKSLEIDFLCTAFSVEGYQFLDPFVKMHKIASCENDHPDLLDALLGFNKPFFRSYGAKTTYDILPREIPMECVAAYPASFEDYSLSIFNNTIIRRFGISDHTLTPELALLALGVGATFFEKHFDACPFESETPDKSVSIGPLDFRYYCSMIRLGEKVLMQPKEIRSSEKDIHKRRKTDQGYFRSKPHE